MDRIDKFINNHSPKKTVLAFFAVLIVSALLSLVLSGKIADYAVREQINAYLLTADGESLSRYGIRPDMPAKLMPGWSEMRNTVFWIIFSSLGLCSLFWTVFAIHRVFEIYNQLETLSRECRKSADKLDNMITMHGEDACCVRRISENAELLAKRMTYLNRCLEYEKNYLRDFLGDFSHQIKTALAVIRLNADMLTETENLPEEQTEELYNEIQLNLDGVELLVVQAIKLARLESQTVEYNMQNLCFADTCNTALKRISPVLRSRNISLTADLPCNIRLNHDKGWLCEAIENLLKNSADHSECTEIRVELEENPAMIKLSMTDNGKGIPQQDIPTLFEPFARKISDITMKSAGLGMSVAQKIVRNHSGEIVVYSEQGKGTRFEIVFIKS
ncbi:MAG: HAMP domain-containing histidine kinase [Ruminococcus flavefaciens]|nr:HAMP domain-containing histidine kinase [Ruminococcus flavefaciens]MCM1229368.1 HAMP domain-containing histidine kinase [Ruminococcus flavefaciens]